MLAEAWALAHERGVLSLTLEQLDALYGDAQRQLRERGDRLPPTDEPREALRQWLHTYARYSAEDPVRWQLLTLRIVRDFEPSPESYAIALANLEYTRSLMHGVGITEPAHLDLLTGIFSGIVHQQLANEPGGNRWLRLIDEALDMFVDTREVRRRLVVAQDRERRRIERDLHDGVQQHLVALKVAAGTARTIAERENATKTAELLSSFAEDASLALDALRELARGIYPPLLAAEGIAAALAAAATRAPLDITVDARGLRRYGEDIEAAVYFCCLEALQNVAKYAGASKASVVLEEDDGVLVFRVVDDGSGFDVASTPRGSGTANMADRVGSLGGTLFIDAVIGSGTTVCGRIPLDR